MEGMHASSVAMAFSHAWQPYIDKKPCHRAMDISHARGMDFRYIPISTILGIFQPPASSYGLGL
jgi:hypothetical protein